MKDISEYENREEIEKRMHEVEKSLDEASPCNCPNNPPCNRCMLQTELDDLVDAIAEDDKFQRECEVDINSNRY